MPDTDRIETINTLVDNFGGLLLTLTEGDWDLALSVSLALLSSVVAQHATNNNVPWEPLFEETGIAARAATGAYYEAFAGEDDGEETD